MFRENVINRIEKGRGSYENTGSLLEHELIGTVNENKYKEEAYKLLHRDQLPTKDDTPEEKFEKMLHVREMARQELETAEQLADRSNYLNYRDSMDLVEQCQVGNPENPARFFAHSLHEYISNRFSEKYVVKYFTAAGGTHLDVLHGVDCYFKIYDRESGRELTSATVDLTKNRKKTTAKKANVLFYISDEQAEKIDPSHGNKEFDKAFLSEKIAEMGEMVVDALLDNYKKNSN